VIDTTSSPRLVEHPTARPASSRTPLSSIRRRLGRASAHVDQLRDLKEISSDPFAAI
jgi:hypothetical protein